MVKRQGTVIDRMDQQLQRLVVSQESALAQAQPQRRGVDVEVQTERATPPPSTEKGTGTSSASASVPKKKHQEHRRASRNVPSSSSSSSSSSNSSPSSSDSSPNSGPSSLKSKKSNSSSSAGSAKAHSHPPQDKRVGVLKEPKKRESEPPVENTQDLSTILRDLQLPTIKEQSIYSADNSIRRIDFDSVNFRWVLIHETVVSIPIDFQSWDCNFDLCPISGFPKLHFYEFMEKIDVKDKLH